MFQSQSCTIHNITNTKVGTVINKTKTVIYDGKCHRYRAQREGMLRDTNISEQTSQENLAVVIDTYVPQVKLGDIIDLRDMFGNPYGSFEIVGYNHHDSISKRTGNTNLSIKKIDGEH